MSNSIVLELQQLTTSPGNDVATLLRKALLVATKLKLPDFQTWVNSELQGYKNDAEIPIYRHTRAFIKARNPFRGLIPFQLPADYANKLCNVKVFQPIGTLIELALSNESVLHFPLSPYEEEFLYKCQGDTALEPVRLIGKNAITNVIHGVQTAILEWALRLESEGILGENMSFTAAEVSRAATITITNFQGVLGNVTGSHVNQHLTMNVTAGDFESLKHYLITCGFAPSDIAQLQEAITSDPTTINRLPFGPSVSTWIGNVVGKAASGVYGIGIGAAGDLLAKGIGMYYGIPT